MPQRFFLRTLSASALATCLPALFLSPVPATAQETSQPAAEEPFYDQVAVDVVNVEVYVTDKDGNPVTGLGRDDFEINEDGRPVEIVNFYSVADGRAAELPELQELPEEPGDTTALRTVAPAVPEAQRLHLIVYVDNFNIHPLNRNRVFRRLRAFLKDTVEPGDQVMVASYDRSLHLRHPFTGDPALVNHALTELEGTSGGAMERESERATAVKAIYEARTLRQALSRAKDFSDAGYHELNRALDALAEMIDSLAGLPGRKMLLHVSDGLPTVPGQDLYQAIQQRFADRSAMAESLSYDMSRRYMQIVANANSNRTSFYTVDASGLTVQSGMGAENTATNTNYVIAKAVDGTRRRNLQGTLRLLANKTGGQSVMNTNNVGDGLARFARDFDNYYSLGYRAPVSKRGRYHKIEVRLVAEAHGRRLRHREGYRDKSIEVRMSDAVTAFLVHGFQRNHHGVSIELGPQSPPDEDGFVNVAIKVRIPMEKLVFLPQGDLYVGRLRLYFGAADEEGRDAELQELPFELRIPEASFAAAKRDEVVRVINSTMRPGPQKLVIAVRDEISEERSIVGRYLRVGAQ